jgi:esterase/lipase superfamily enzyme
MRNQSAPRTMHVSWLLILWTGVLLVGGCGGPQLMPTPTIYVDAKTDPFADVPVALQGGKIDILYVTNRAQVATKKGDPSVEYGIERSHSAAYGSCIVEIGEDLPWAEIVKQSRTDKRTEALPLTVRSTKEAGRWGAVPNPLVRKGDLLVTDPAFEAKQDVLTQALYKDIQARLAKTPRKEAFVFVHGFGNTFEDATTTMAELWHFLGREGVPIAYSWPAGAGVSVRGYTEDYESSRFATTHLKWLLKALSECPGLEKIHVIAHSRGTDVATTSLREMAIAVHAAGKDPTKTLKIGNMVLAAPDMDLDVVTIQMNGDRAFDSVERMTIYVSPHDKAIGLSQWIFGGDLRVGDMSVADVNPVQKSNTALRKDHFSLVVAKIKASGVGHSYYRLNPAVESDLIQLLRYGVAPGAPGRPLKPLIPGMWTLDDRYPRSQEQAAD